MAASQLTWKQNGDMYFAHASSGMWTITESGWRYKQNGRKYKMFYVELDLPGTSDASQNMGSYTSLSQAAAASQKAHATLCRDFGLGGSRKTRSHRKAGY